MNSKRQHRQSTLPDKCPHTIILGHSSHPLALHPLALTLCTCNRGKVKSFTRIFSFILSYKLKTGVSNGLSHLRKHAQSLRELPTVAQL